MFRGRAQVGVPQGAAGGVYPIETLWSNHRLRYDLDLTIVAAGERVGAMPGRLTKE